VKIVHRDLSGLTLLELLISLLLLALVMTGLSNVFVVARSYMAHSRSRVAAGQFGKYLMSPLQSEVRQDTFDGGGLQINSSRTAGSNMFLDGITYNATFNISNVTAGFPAGGLLRKVNLTVRWNETGM
jgi:Tfp pilus assembly protein PilV